MVNAEQEKVRQFHEKFDALLNETPTLLNDVDWWLRVDLIREELQEYYDACKDYNLTGIADAIGDMLYVVYGTAVAHGIDIEPIFDEIHRSNMSKGSPSVIKREDGKVLKNTGYKPPELEPILKKQTYKNMPQSVIDEIDNMPEWLQGELKK